jgi:hypothetical protein
LKPTMFWIGSYWTNFGIHALYIIVACCNVASEVFVLYLVSRMFRKYHTLMESMQTGKFKMYEAKAMRNSFAACTYLPGTFVFSSLMAYVAFYLFLFWNLCVLVVNIVLFIIPSTRGWYVNWWVSNILYWAIYLGVIYGIKLIIVEKVCIYKGEIVRPRLLSLCLTVLLVYNFIVGLASAIFRMQFTIIYAIINCFYIESTILPDELLSWDTGYYSFLASTYTWYERLNPIKKAFQSILMPSVHMSYAPEAGKYFGNSGSKLSVNARRVRNKFALAITLFRNPELQGLRRRRGKADEDND